MQRQQDMSLIYATLILAVIAAILSCTPVRRALDGYISASPAFSGRDLSIVIGNNMTEDPSNPVTALEWRVPMGN